jgi:hypothetical protein
LTSCIKLFTVIDTIEDPWLQLMRTFQVVIKYHIY